MLIPAGLWHGSVTPLEATDVLVVFRADVGDEWTELPKPVPLCWTRRRSDVRCGLPAAADPRALSALLVPELVEPVVVDAEVVGELVDDRLADLLLEVARIGEVLLERQPVQGDPVRDGAQSAPHSVRGTPSYRP